jgi:putative endonuclease
MPYYVYILRCSNGTFYTGSTSNLQERVFDHISGFDPKAYTFQLRPVNLVWAEEFETRIDALNIEKQIKGWSHAKKKALIEDDFEEIRQIVKKERKRREK